MSKKNEVKKMTETFCAGCGRALTEGSLKYIVQIKIFSDFDGYIPYSEDSSGEMQRLLEEVEDMDAQELEDDVYQELSVCLCINCKKKFTKGLITGEEEDSSSKKNLRHLYH